MTDPTIPHVVSVKGDSTSAEGDVVRVTVYLGSTARGTTTTTLDSNKEALVDLANFATGYEIGDTLVVSVSGKGLTGDSTTISSKGSDFSLSTTAIAFPSRNL